MHFNFMGLLQGVLALGMGETGIDQTDTESPPDVRIPHMHAGMHDLILGMPAQFWYQPAHLLSCVY